MFEINENKYKYFKCNFDEKTNYALTFEEICYDVIKMK